MKIFKKYWWVLLIIVLLIVAIIFFSKKNKLATGAGVTMKGDAGYRQSFVLGRFDHKGGQEVAVTIMDTPQVGTIKAGDIVVIEGAGPYSGSFMVKKPWVDGTGRLGALFIDIPGVEVLPATTREYRYQNIGKLHLV